MIKLIVTNKRVFIKNASIKIIRQLEKILSYRVQGFMFAPSFKQKRWDGREHLLKFNRKIGYYAPVGLLGNIINKLEEKKIKYEVEDKRKISNKKIEYELNEDLEFRPYQLEAIEAITKDNIFKGRGILKMPIRSGKTKVAAGIIYELKKRSLFVVPSQMLLYQSQESLSYSLQVEVGLIGDSEWNEENITVATVQSLVHARKNKNKKYEEILKTYDLIFFDECHHLTGDSWRKVMEDFNAPFKIGLSATVFLENEKENERGVIWLQACCGNVRYEVSTSTLIEEGFLLRPRIELHAIRQPDLTSYRWSKELRDRGVLLNPTRNKLIVELAVQHVKKGFQVLIVSNRLNQVSAIAEMLDDYSVSFAVVTGKNSSYDRKQKVKLYVEGEYEILIGTVFAEGVDIPEIDVVINAEGGKDVKRAVQRMRNLTPSENKIEAIFIDFLDFTNGYFADHSKERLQVYRSEPAFEIKVIEKS